MKRILSILLLAGIGFSAVAQEQNEMRTIEIGLLSTTHVLFTSDLTYVDISMQDVVVAKIVEASKNMLALKAKVEFDFTTTISALEANGTMHTIQVKFNAFPENLLVDTRIKGKVTDGTMNTQIRPVQQQPQSNQPAEEKVKYVSSSSIPTVRINEPPQGINVTSTQASNFGRADAPTLEEIMKRPQQLYHIGDRNFKLEAYCTNIYVYSDFIYVVLKVKNNSDIGYEAGDAQFAIETKTRKKKFLESDRDVWAKSSFGTLSCPPRSTTMVGYTIPKFTLLRNESLRIYIYEKKGNRNLVLTVNDKDINYAISPLE